MSIATNIKIPAKLNLFLKVNEFDGNKHIIDTLFHSVNLFDTISLSLARRQKKQIRVTFRDCDDSGLKLIKPIIKSENNLAVKAVKMFEKLLDEKLDINITINKKIPLGAGLAGGSADAAGVLLGLNKLLALDLSQNKLALLASKLGADVPFQIKKGSAIGGRYGDVVEYLPNTFEYHFVLATYNFELSTPEIYTAFDELDINAKINHGQLGGAYNISMTAKSLLSNNPHNLAKNIHNDLQTAAISVCSKTNAKRLKTALDFSCSKILASFITGSGPTVVFLVENQKDAICIAKELKQKQMCDQAYVVRSVL